MYHIEGINVLDFCLCLFTDLNQHDIEFITASDYTIPIWTPSFEFHFGLIQLITQSVYLLSEEKMKKKGEGDYWDHHYYHQ